MANTYMSPNPFMSPQGYGGMPWDNPNAGGGRGFEEGENRGLLDQIMSRQFRDSDLQNQSDQLDLQDKQAKMPSLQSKYDLETAANKTSLGSYDDGSQAALLKSDINTKLNDNQLKAAKNRLEKQLTLGTEAESMDDSLKAFGGQIPPSMMNHYKDAWKEAGFPELPDNPQEAAATISQYAQLHRASGPRIEEALKHMYEMEAMKGKTDAEERMNAATNTTRLGVAGIQANATKSTSAVLGQIQHKIAQSGVSSLSEGELDVLGMEVNRMADPTVNKDLAFKFDQIEHLTSSEQVKQAMRDRARDDATNGMYSKIKRAQAAQSGEAAPTATPPTAPGTGITQSALKTETQAAQPDRDAKALQLMGAEVANGAQSPDGLLKEIKARKINVPDGPPSKADAGTVRRINGKLYVAGKDKWVALER